MPFDQVEVIYAADRKQQGEVKTKEAVRTGMVDRSWLERALREAGCEGA